MYLDMIRILIADDHTLVRRGLRAILDHMDNVEVVGEATNGIEAVDLAQELKPDIIVMDVSMPRLDGIGATDQISRLALATHIVVLSMYDDPDLVQKALQTGADGYLVKRSVSEELMPAIKEVSQGKRYISRHIATS
jgi:DNA-binding NarL/FixJ family response regulator